MTYSYGDIVFDEFQAVDDDFMKYVSWLKNYENMKYIMRKEYWLSMRNEEIEAYVKRQNDSECDSFFKVVYDGQFIGTYKVGHIDWWVGTADLGIMIGDDEFKGKGLSSKIMTCGIKYSFDILGLRRLDGNCHLENTAMCKCFERCGFVKEGVRRKAYISGGKYCDHAEYGLLREEYDC